ncbi:NFACT RNA binding domain-containing protein [Salidesulfovibrio onnuriiensis]|uniref:NFACT RNA binding domain-containing protein n=1 Tax=Salidesulfovibrio onnuriiensis TaxID=2583823 RepID=UPI0011C73049|nr:NFACT RNA binding domain-containing protein [Salidesulfovibrio onnuriiensis]
MEATFFRFLAAELGPLLNSRRIEKIYGPAPEVWTFKLQSTGEQLNLLFRPAKSAGHLFTSPLKPANPQQAPAKVMWFRKRLQGRRLLEHHVDWPTLRIAWELTPSRNEGHGNILLFDVRNGLQLLDELPSGFGAAPEWPALEDIRDNDEIWREYPHVSPPLRKYLKGLPEAEAHAAYFKVVCGESNQFHCSRDEQKHPPLAWPRANDDLAFTSALEAASHYGAQTLFPLLEMEDTKETTSRIKSERKRLHRNLARLDQEETRLRKFIANKQLAEALQAELYRLKGLEGAESVEVIHPTEGPVTVALNPFLTVTENMERYFKLAHKGTRGLEHVKRRRLELNRELGKLENGSVPEKQAAAPQSAPVPVLPKRFKGLAVSVFVSSDGFTMVRGKNKKANHDIISKTASTFDYWLHVSDGPSSHVILRRDHPNQEIPESTLREAAMLCALKSYRKDDARADVMYALVKDVRKVKGFAHGQVVIKDTLGTIRVELDPALEKKLAK